MVDRDDLGIGVNHLGVERSNDGLLDDLRPLASCEADLLLVHRLELALTDLKHERPVGTLLLCGIL